MERAYTNKFSLNSLGIFPLRGEHEGEYLVRANELLYDYNQLIEECWSKTKLEKVIGEVSRERVLACSKKIYEDFGMNLNWMKVGYCDNRDKTLLGRVLPYRIRDGVFYPSIPLITTKAKDRTLIHEMIHAAREPITPKIYQGRTKNFEEALAEKKVSWFRKLFIKPEIIQEIFQIEQARETLEKKVGKNAGAIIVRLLPKELHFLNKEGFDKFKNYLSWQKLSAEHGLRLGIILEEYF